MRKIEFLNSEKIVKYYFKINDQYQYILIKDKNKGISVN